MPKPRVVYLHGDGVLSWRYGWVTRTQQALASASFPTFFELFPDSIEARAKYWLPFLREHIRAGEDDVLLGWSCGSVAALRFAQEQRVRGLVLVAPYFTDLGGYPEVLRSGWVTEPWDWAQVRNNAGPIAMFCSDNDPYIPQTEFQALAQHLQARVFHHRGAGHFAQEELPEVADYIARTFG